MNKKLLLSALIYCTLSFSQEQCGTMKNLEEQIKKDPSLKERMLQIEKQNQEWIERNGMAFYNFSESELNKKIYSKSLLNTNDLCGYNNTFFTSVTAPTTLNTIVSPSPNCTYGGEYVRVNNLVAGRTYRISTCGFNNFDTQITVYPAGGGNAVAFNDDWCGTQSEIYFTPITSGNYDILVDEFNCLNNSLCANLQIELWYIPRSIITIPVVVHVIHNGEPIGTGTNISDAQIQSQIDVLNEDFRRQNIDILNVPAAFRGASADPLIQFCLAQQKPDGTTTNGIMRYPQPSQAEFNQNGVPSDLQCINRFTMESIIKPLTIWNRDKYLNIWVVDMRQLPPIINGEVNNNIGDNQGCSFSSETLGYAQFPGGQPNTDGVVVKFNVFGRVGNLNSTFNLGRTTTHEVGHWLNLKHIWGDENNCAFDDFVIDTPLQSTPNYGCNIFPYIDTCSLNYPGVMFMNYMDYSNDNCLALFTYGQFVRMDSVLFNQRIGLLNSTGCMPGTLTLNQFENLKISIYPNPTQAIIYFDNNNNNFKEVTIYNYIGQEVAKFNFTSISKNQEVDMSYLSNGVYILKFKNDKAYQSVKVIKQ